MKVVALPKEVEARQITTENVKKIAKWLGASKITTIEHNGKIRYQFDDFADRHLRSADLGITPGSWIVLDPEQAFFYVHSDEHFKEEYISSVGRLSIKRLNGSTERV